MTHTNNNTQANRQSRASASVLSTTAVHQRETSAVVTRGVTRANEIWGGSARSGVNGVKSTKTEGASAKRTASGHNVFLSMLPPETRGRIEPDLELVSLRLGDVLHEPGRPVRHAYFPNDCVVSLTNVTKEGEMSEISEVGSEGVVGLAGMLGWEPIGTHANVLRAGTAYKLPSRLLQEEFDRHNGLQRLVLRYTQWLLVEAGQRAICNRHHSVEQQVCGCLMRLADRVLGDQFFMTHEMLANRLGVRREGVTTSAAYLRDLGLIQYQRGHIKVLAKDRLQNRCCECYEVLNRERASFQAGFHPDEARLRD